MKKLTIVMLSLTLALTLGACEEVINMIPAESTENQDEIITQPLEEDGASVIITPGVEMSQASLALGEILVVQIPTIPQQDFEWVVEDLDTSILVQEGKPLFQAEVGPDSAGGITYLQFRAVGVGETTLNFAYVNTSDEGSTELTQQTYGVRVTVRSTIGEVVAVRPKIQGNEVTLNVGDTLVVEIPTIPQESFQWIVENIDNSILIQEGDAEYKPDTRSADAAGGITYLTFKAIGAGETHLNMAYASVPAEGPSLSQDTFGLLVTVNDPSQGTVVVTPAIEGLEVTLTLGDTLIVEIPTIPQEGFEWVVEDIDTSILVQEGGPTYKEQPDTSSDSGKVFLEFKAVGRGTTVLNLAYLNEQSGDTGQSSLTQNTFGMTVEVQ